MLYEFLEVSRVERLSYCGSGGGGALLRRSLLGNGGGIGGASRLGSDGGVGDDLARGSRDDERDEHAVGADADVVFLAAEVSAAVVIRCMSMTRRAS